MRTFYSLLLWALTMGIAVGQSDLFLVPQPKSIQKKSGVLVLKRDLALSCPAELRKDGRLLEELFALEKEQRGAGKTRVLFSLRSELLEEGYRLVVTEKNISIEAGSPAGIFYGLQTLLQTLHRNEKNQWCFPVVSIEDEPAFAYRGMHLDVSRHFFSVGFIKKYIDALALHKMNRFHWHLTDDQGWRIEIKAYPELTSIGAYRGGSQIGPYSDHRFDTLRYGGFYSQKEIAEVVAYAAERYVTIVPEIEMPGHALAALAAYPQWSCTGNSFSVGQGWGVFEDVFCAGNDSTFLFLETVLSEVMALFPSEYIHIGGDECPKKRWHDCLRCQNRMKTEGLADEHALQSYFIQRIETFLLQNGRKLIGWDEILEGGLAPQATVMSWRGEAGGIAAAQSGHFAIMTPGSPLYFDHYQSKNPTEPHAIGGFNPVEKIYLYSPVPAVLSPQESVFIQGAQGNVWTEYMTTEQHVEYMVHPRMAALSEVLWTGPRKESDLPDFKRRVDVHAQRLEQKGYVVAPHFLPK